ncbi:MAG: alpha-hydroxy-acid oxidizing protein [Acidobacteria bacterium]|nr:MAG: alpha-hydroxy-acid oxidizing protein [Acidobacteriota bacterium]
MDPTNLNDFEELARERLPASHFGYLASGADDEITLEGNRRAFERLRLRPRYLVDVSSIELGIELLGQRLSMPILLAPTAFQVLAHADGELATARAAAAAGTVFVASTLSSKSLQEIAAASDGPRWFQLYCARDRGITKTLVEAAAASGYQALCLTVDVPVLGHREADVKNRFRLPPEALPGNLTPLLDLDGLTEEAQESALARLIDRLFDPSLSWKDLEWLRSLSDLPLVLKGIMTAEDAKLALHHGVDGIVVSNHGGRQLDGASPTIDVLPEIVEVVDARCPVLLDGGVRRGTDVLKALALGADAVLVGRPYLWGLAADGEAGVGRVLDLLRSELARALALVGRPSIDDVDPTVVERRRWWRS